MPTRIKIDQFVVTLGLYTRDRDYLRLVLEVVRDDVSHKDLVS